MSDLMDRTGGQSVIKLIARGSHGEINEVADTDGRIFAEKRIRLPLPLVKEASKAIIKLKHAYDREKQALCLLDHRNVVKFMEMKVDEGESLVTVRMEMIRGTTLLKFIDDGLTEDVTREFAGQICSALSYLHGLERAVLHRDINCKTIMVTEDRRIKLINFGLAVQLVESASDHLSTDPRGDPCFMAPELFIAHDTEKTPYTCASDIWAFGCVVYQMVTGSRPHSDCKNMLAIARRLNQKGAPALSDASSAALKDFYQSCTERRHADRKSAAQLLHHAFLIQTASALPSAGGMLALTAGSEVLPSQCKEVDQPAEFTSASPPSEDASSPTNKAADESATPPQGLCLLVNLDRYDDPTRFPDRPTAQKDAGRIRGTFERLGYQVVQKDNPKVTELWDFLQGIASMKSELAEHRCLICCVLAHGVRGLVFTSDGEPVPLRDVLARFSAGQCPGLREKPKLFFVQTGGGSELDDLVDPDDEHSFRLCDKNFLVSSGTSDGSSSFVQTLCDVIEGDGFGSEDIECVVAEANERQGLGAVKKGDRFCSSTSACTSNLLTKFHLGCHSDVRVFGLPKSAENWTDEQLASECKSADFAYKTYGPMLQTLLMIAAIKGNVELFCHLLKQSTQASVSKQDMMGMTAVSWAACKGHDNILAAFQEAYENDPNTVRTEVNRADHLKRTPIILAAKDDQWAMLERLVKMGADVDSEDSAQTSALMFAAKLGHLHTVEELLRIGANPRVFDFSGNSPLIWAARCGHTEVIRKLAACVTDVAYWKQKGEQKLNAQEWAKFCGRTDCAILIQDIIQNLVKVTDQCIIGLGSGGPQQDPSGSSGGQQFGSGSGSGASGGNSSASGQSGGSGDDPGGQTGMPESSAYSMAEHQRGIALIINILDYPSSSSLGRRDGSMEDMREDRLYQCFSRLGFDCSQFTNAQSQFFQGFLEVICTNGQLRACSSFLLCIMSHGELGSIYASDGVKVLLEDIFSTVRLRMELSGKPKIFIVQACRDIPEDGLVTSVLGQRSAERHEDCLYMYSVVSGGSSTRNRVSGGLFTKVLCDVILNNFDQANEAFTDAIPKVVRKVCDESGFGQVPCFMSTLRGRLAFDHVGCIARES